MSLKEDIAIVKEEISTEEQFLTSSIKIERFFKKYKKIFIALIVICVASAIGYVAYDNYENSRLEAANTALVKLMKNPDDNASAEVLKSKSPKLYEAYEFSLGLAKNDLNAIKKSSTSTNPIIADLSKYQLASISGNEAELKAYALGTDAILKDMANFMLAQKAIESGNVKAADDYLAKIPTNSSLKEQALYLEHLLIKTNKTK